MIYLIVWMLDNNCLKIVEQLSGEIKKIMDIILIK